MCYEKKGLFWAGVCVLFVGAIPKPAEGSSEIVAFDIVGEATASGELFFELHARGPGCAGTILFAYSQVYDATPMSGEPTTVTELATAIHAGLDALLPPEFTVGSGKKDQPPDPHSAHVSIEGSEPLPFDVCVISDGSPIEIVGDDTTMGSHTENGITVRGQFRYFVPALTPWGMLVVSLLVIAAGTVIIVRRRRALAM